MRALTGAGGRTAIERAGDEAARSPALHGAARLGHAAKAIVWAVIGVLALSLAVGAGGRTTDSKGAVASIAAAPAGRALVAVLAAGLAALALWLVVDAIADPGGRRRSGAMAIGSRVGQAISGLAYGALAYAAVRLALLQGAGQGGDEAARSWTAKALSLPGGRAIVLAGAAVALFVGGRQIWNGAGRKFLKQLELSRMSARLRRWAARTGAVGFVTQGAVFALVGVFFAQAAIERDAREATGFDGALQAIARQPLGMALLAAVALGLLAFAAYTFIEGAHRKMGGS
jgi:hypothetical protein